MEVGTKLLFQCCHCQEKFSLTVTIADKTKSGHLVYQIVDCPHCGQKCEVKIDESAVSTSNVFRGNHQWTTEELAQLEGQVFSTQPV